ncbi:MAG: 2-oxo acid dehydrogenase subunit E2 [Actinobacteria bacterium]|nr:2-oxo acid dehydrogenase subunit E2 [Actinomycetota bacterium]
MAEIVMPQLGETVTEGTITKWFKRVGDPVARDEILFEVSTEKVDSEVPSVVDGVLAEIRVVEGTTVGVGTVLAVISSPAGDVVVPAATVASPAPIAPPPAAAPSPAAAALPPPVAADAVPAAAAPPEARLLSPIVRRLVADHGIDLATVVGTGPGGRVTRDDVQRAIDRRQQASGTPIPTAPAAPVPPPAPSAALAPPAAAGEAVTVPAGSRREPFNRIRKLTGDHMVRSKATSPHVLTAMEVDFSAVDRVRSAHRDRFRAEEGFGLTYLPFLCRAVSDAIAEFPALNASVDGDDLVLHRDVNLAIAVDLGFEGLVAPVVRNVEGKRLRLIAREISDLARRARARQLRPDDLGAGTFTITNPGQYGTLLQFPVISQPQVAILSTDGVRRKPWVITDADGAEAIAIRPIGVLALAWDHRAFDGAYAAAFLDRVRRIVEERDWSSEVA